nr:translation initiation factor 2 [Actinomyces sp. zg328]
MKSMDPDRIARVAHSRSRRSRAARLAALAVPLALSACTANLEMEIGADGRYSAVIEMRDSTGKVLTSKDDCQRLADKAVAGTSASAQAEVVEADDDEIACKITVSGVEIPASDQASSDALVVREDDLYAVDLTRLTDGLTTPTGKAGAGGDSAPSGRGGSQGPQGPAPTVGAGPTAPPLDSRISVTFPGAVVDGGGGSVDGRTVTWEDTDTILAGIHATGHTRANAGLSFWDRYSWWVIGGTAGLAAAVAVAALRRRRARG